MSKLYCETCNTRTKFKPFQTGLFKYNGETVKVCRKCGHLRTKTEIRVPQAEIIHKPTQTKYKNMEK